MSTTKIKSATRKLMNHLGRDSVGIGILNELTRLVTDLRKDNRENTELAEESSAAASAARQALEDARRKLGQAEVRVRQATDRASSAEARAKLAEARLEQELSPPKQEQRVVSSNRIVEVIKRARAYKRIPNLGERCNVRQARYKARGGRDPAVLNIEDFLDDRLSDESIWYMGACVFSVCSLDGTVLCQQKEPLDVSERYGKVKPAAFNNLMSLLQNSVDPADTGPELNAHSKSNPHLESFTFQESSS